MDDSYDSHSWLAEALRGRSDDSTPEAEFGDRLGRSHYSSMKVNNTGIGLYEVILVMNYLKGTPRIATQAAVLPHRQVYRTG